MLKKGRLPARHDLRTMRSALALFPHLAALGTPPAVSNDYVAAVDKQTGGDWGMALNDSLGDCTCADSAHQVMLHTANAGTMVSPSNAQVLAMYEAVGGYKPGDPSTDQGADETTVCRYLQSTGLAGQKSAGTGMLDPAQLDHVRWATQLFGACRLGILVDSQLENAYQSGQPWVTPPNPNDPDSGGHDVPVVKYDATYAYVVTWGKLQPVAWSLMSNSTFLSEAHAEVWPDFIAATGSAPNGFNLQQLLADLPSVLA